VRYIKSEKTRREILREAMGLTSMALLTETASAAEPSDKRAAGAHRLVANDSPLPSSAEFFPDFTKRTFVRNGVKVVGVVGGNGPPLLLLHGYPETHLCWHKVAPSLASRFTVVALDLRGYGDSDKPPTNPLHEPYSKREMAEDVRSAMATLGYERFFVAGHDRGARVAQRLALDHPEAVTRLAVLDMAPTLAQYENTTMRSATLWFHWFFLIQKADYPEHFIGEDPRYFLLKVLGMGPAGMAPYADAVVAQYLRCLENPATVHGICEDYRASAGIDLEQDRTDRDHGIKVECPVLALWGTKSILPAAFDVEALWKEYASNLQTRTLDCGHFLQEERPQEVADVLHTFFS
jgi:haloacetate dehalogenase